MGKILKHLKAGILQITLHTTPAVHAKKYKFTNFVNMYSGAHYLIQAFVFLFVKRYRYCSILKYIIFLILIYI